MRIGFPKILLQYYKYGILCETFLKELKIDYIYSDCTNKKIVEDSLKVAQDEICIPVKLIYGHSLNLKGKCDKILVSRIISLKPNTITCPRLRILPELVSIQTEMEVLKLNINIQKYPLFFSFFTFGLKLRKNPISVVLAYYKAFKKYNKEIQELKEKRERFLKEEKIKIALIGHSYLIYDKFISLDILGRLKDVNVFVSEMADEVKELPATYWSEERELLNAAYYFIDKVDGIVLLTSFLCGTGSLINEFIFSRAKECKVPIMQLIVDENTTETMVDTRIQAFLNMIWRKKICRVQ
jgi:predicted nucleotide-binding protein (sugar kinase/HSP70/actin superfamily)